MIDQHDELLPKNLTPNEVREWKNYSSSFSVDGETKEFLRRIFGDFLDFFSDQEKNRGNERWRNLATDFLNLTLDSGLRRNVALFGETLKPVYMFGRMGGTVWLKKEIGLREEKDNNGNFQYSVKKENFQILRLDVSNVFSANQIEGGRGGDYLLNKVAWAINKSVDGLRDELGENARILPIRYGGDEFIIFVTGGELSDQQINNIKDEITNQEAFFEDNKENKKSNIGLKNNEIELINPKEIKDREKKQLFYSFLKRGVILSVDELNKEYNKIKELNTNPDSFQNYINEAAAVNVYPEEITSIKEEQEKIKAKIEYILSLHPEFKVPFYLAGYLDAKEGKPLLRQSAMLTILEDYLIDPLLNRVIITRFDLKDHLQRENINKILSFEIKLKEVNEYLGYGYADMLIVKLWQRIKEILGEDRLKQIKVMRFGGLISLLIFDDKITADQKRALTEISLNLNNITHYVGFSETKIKDYENFSQEEKIEAIINRIFKEPETNWMEKNLRFILGEGDILNIFVQKIKERKTEINEEELTDNNKREQVKIFLRYLLNEKRGKLRRFLLEQVLMKINKEVNDSKLKERISELLAMFF